MELDPSKRSTERNEAVSIGFDTPRTCRDSSTSVVMLSGFERQAMFDLLVVWGVRRYGIE